MTWGMNFHARVTSEPFQVGSVGSLVTRLFGILNNLNVTGLPHEIVPPKFDKFLLTFRLIIFGVVYHWFIEHDLRVEQCLGIVRAIWFN